LLTEIMGGDISVTSTPGKGSTFKVSLMLSSLHEVTPRSITAPARRIYGYHGTRRKVLIVDDDLSHRQVIRAMLSPLGFDVGDMGNSLLVSQQVSSDRPDLILLDVSMPGLNGWEILQQLRDAQHHMPVIMISADANEGQHSPGSPHLHNGYIIKPVRLNLLLDTIGKVLNIEWRFKPRPDPRAALEPPEQAELTLPGYEECQALMSLARIGHRKGLLEALNELKHSGKADSHFTTELTKLTNEFQFEKILALLEVPEHESA